MVAVYGGAKLAAGTPAEIARFLGIEDANFRGGARSAVGDVNGDGTPDLLVAAGFGGGPRVAVYNGRTVTRSRWPPGRCRLGWWPTSSCSSRPCGTGCSSPPGMSTGTARPTCWWAAGRAAGHGCSA